LTPAHSWNKLCTRFLLHDSRILHASGDPRESRRRGVGVVTRYDKLVLSTMNDFFNTLTDNEIAARYVPEVS